MSLAVVKTRALVGVQGEAVSVEVHLANGLPAFNIVGLPETAVKESKDRVRGAIINSAFEFPARRITVNLAPADLPKTGGRFDLPIAIGILLASGQIKSDFTDYELLGELALTGELRGVPGVLPTAIACKHSQSTLIVPMVNADEAAVVSNLKSFYAESLSQVAAYINDQTALPECELNLSLVKHSQEYDLLEVKGQLHAKRALEVAASGGHNLLFIGPPGTGKSMLAQRLPGILPDLTIDEGLQVSAINSVKNGVFDVGNWRKRSIRSPHHSSSSVALVGGGVRSIAN